MRRSTAGSHLTLSTRHTLTLSTSFSVHSTASRSRAWHQCFATFLRQLGFVASATDASLFIFTEGNSTAYLLLNVDDIVPTASLDALLRRLIGRLYSEFAMTHLGELHHFLGIFVTAPPMVSSSASGSTLSTFFRRRAWPSVSQHKHLLTLVPSSLPRRVLPSPTLLRTGVLRALFNT